ncbi:hypothetical protein RhiirA1_128853 [Rhizophagus irregularis]|uniref:Uncharacterized protein n=1 Tax=Rhizophagus irregularis TaxID=588596 RepID=A0A2N0QVD0_9GLOM|nr:hypothetical protein RhiirA1_128853 [Rhizophagus irregularis]
MYILRYDETKGSDPNLQYWRVYVSFLREGTDSTIPYLVYQTTEKLNNITIKSCSVLIFCFSSYYCIAHLLYIVVKYGLLKMYHNL